MQSSLVWEMRLCTSQELNLSSLNNHVGNSGLWLYKLEQNISRPSVTIAAVCDEKIAPAPMEGKILDSSGCRGRHMKMAQARVNTASPIAATKTLGTS